jgi:restriction system protein
MIPGMEQTKAKVPDYRHYFNPLLRSLRTLGGSAGNEELDTRIAEDMKLSEDVLSVPHSETRPGLSEVGYRIAWARTYLKKAGLITNSERGVWSLTPEGMKTESVDERKLAREVQEAVKLTRGTEPREAREKEEEGEEAEFEDEPTQGVAWKEQLLATLNEMPPDAFERLSQRLLRESGFVEVRVTGRTGDEGIDGIGLLRLGGVLTFHVIFQCKRYKKAVTPTVVRDFRGAMVGRTDKGLVIITSYFTRKAVEEATRAGAPPIDLIDGEQLADLLRKLKLGVSTEMVEKVTVNPEFFKTV